MTVLTRIVLGTELQRVLNKIDTFRQNIGMDVLCELFQLDGADKFRIVITVALRGCDWSSFGLEEPKS